MRRSFLLVLAGIATALACGTQIPTTGLTDDGDGGTPPPMDSGGGTGDGQTVAEDGSVPPPTGGNGNVDPCEEGYQPGAKDLYVAQNGSPEKECGTTAMPCTLAVALERRPQTINIADGDYPIATPVVWTDTTIRIFGGWTVTGAEWKRTCQEGKVHIKSLGRAAIEMKSSAATLSYIDVESKTVGGLGESLYGLLVTQQSRLTLDHVRVKAGQGGANPNGARVPVAEYQLECGGQADGKAGDAGAPGEVGESLFGAGGVDTTTRLATTGAKGGTGHLGTPGSAPGPTKGMSCKGGLTMPATAPSVCTAGPCTHLTPNPGSAGCGAFGGAGGSPGGNGGSSIALYVSERSTVSVIGGSLESAGGGAGGVGTQGGAPAVPGSGAPGEPQLDKECPFDNTDDSYCNTLPYPACDPTDATSAYNVDGGEAGGPGGAGGNGGAGGDGAGGHSYAWARDGSSSVELTATPLLKPGTAGAGANADAGTGKVF